MKKTLLSICILMIIIAGTVIAGCSGSAKNSADSAAKESKAQATTTTVAVAPQPTIPPTTLPAPKTVVVQMKPNAFVPGQVTINVGDTILWKNVDTQRRNPIGDGQEFGGNEISPGVSISHVFTESGTYTYHDVLFPQITGVIIVQ